MWIFLNRSMVSIVEHHNKPGVLLVRGRLAGDVQRFLGLPAKSPRVTSSPTRDYLYRAEATVQEVEEAVARAVRSINYGNFKGSVDNEARHDAYVSVWSAMYRAQANEQREAERRGLAS